MKCDICSSPFGETGGHRIASSEFRASVTAGFNPYITPGFDISRLKKIGALFGVDNSEAAKYWKARVLQDKTDWILCDTCYPLFLSGTEQTKMQAAEAAKRQAESDIRRREAEAKRRLEEERKRNIQSERRAHKECILCGEPLNGVDRLFRRLSHRTCQAFVWPP